jgi:amino acid transporter
MKKRTDEIITNHDSADLQHMGYAQELFRGMGGFSNFAVSFSVISILTGATQLYGYGLQHGGPLQMSLGWIIVSVFTMMVALSMAELASSYPTSGALYHWSSFLGGRKLGWFTACFNTIGQFAILAGVDYGLAQFLVPLLNFQPSPLNLTLIYAAILFSHALLNHIGIKVVAWLNDFSAWYHIGVVILLLCALSFKGFVQPVTFLFHFSSSDGFRPSYSFLIGLLLAQWTMTGFDASAHVTEETLNPRKNAPWGIILAVLVSAFVGLAMLSAVTLSISDLSQALAFGDGAFYEILKLRLGQTLGTTLVAFISGAMWLCGLATMTSASRMVYAFARDRGLPRSKIWAHVSEKYRSPTHAIWGLALASLILAVSVKLYSAVVSIATIALYISYGLPILARILGRLKNKPDEIGPWHLGRFSQPISIIGLLWIAFIIVDFVLPPNDQAGIVMGGFTVLLFGLWHFLVRHKFTGPQYHPHK